MSATRAGVTALILAGGKATRLGGIDKRELVVDGATIFERQIAVLAPCVAEILVSSPRPIAGYRTVADTVPDAGPLAGIAAGLAATATPWLLVVAGDMPHLSPALVATLLAIPVPEPDAVGVRVGALYEPLLCVLRVAVARPIAAARLASGRFAAQRLLTDGELVVHWLDESRLRAIDPELKFLTNVNRPEDLSSSRGTADRS